MSILCLKIWTPLTLCTFSKLTPQNEPFSKIVPPPPRNVINDRSLTPNSRTQFFAFNVDHLHEFSLPLLANFLGY